VNLKGYYEFDAQNRPGGWNTWLTLAIPFGSAKYYAAAIILEFHPHHDHSLAHPRLRAAQTRRTSLNSNW